jgi:vanillate/4-hydroxybenzoate decarboxylase subunit D
MHTFPRPAATHLGVDRTPVSGPCPECGAENLADYRVLGEGGWWDVRKCQSCLASVDRRHGPLFGVYTPLGLSVAGPVRRTNQTRSE